LCMLYWTYRNCYSGLPYVNIVYLFCKILFGFINRTFSWNQF